MSTPSIQVPLGRYNIAVKGNAGHFFKLLIIFLCYYKVLQRIQRGLLHKISLNWVAYTCAKVIASNAWPPILQRDARCANGSLEKRFYCRARRLVIYLTKIPGAYNRPRVIIWFCTPSVLLAIKQRSRSTYIYIYISEFLLCSLFGNATY